MKRLLTGTNPFIVGGFLASLFSGFLNPVYITLILARLDGRVIAAGSLLSAAFPFAIGLVLEDRRLFRRLYRLLPLVMALEVLVALLSVAVAAVDLAAYYLVAMVVCGVFSSSVLYMLHKTKERRVRRARAAFDRRCAMADAIGFFTGSAVSMVGLIPVRTPTAVVLLGALQTLIVYLLLLGVHRPVPARRPRREAASDEAEEPLAGRPPWSADLQAARLARLARLAPLAA
jgi:hypothetical protein